MKRIYQWLFLLLCVLQIAAAALGQNTTITASHIAKFGGSAITGTFCLSPVNQAGQPINITTPAGVQFSPQTPLCFPITAGVLSNFAIVPDVSLTQPANACYALTINDNFNRTIGAYPCLQPSGSTWSFDAYVPTSLPSIPVLTLPQFKVNGVLNATQGIVNFVGAGVSYGSGGQVILNGSGGGGGGSGAVALAPIKLVNGRIIFLVLNNSILME